MAEGPRRGTGVESRPASAADGSSSRPVASAPAFDAQVLRPVEQEAPIRPAAEVTMEAPAVPPAPSVVPADSAGNGSEQRPGQCTAPQLRRFIKSRPYVPMHELRRRFSINGEDDDVTPVRIDPGWIYVGLPSHEGRLLGDLLRTGEIGYELSLDPRTPIVVGVYPMRPIARN
jgi:hypothetical protein